MTQLKDWIVLYVILMKNWLQKLECTNMRAHIEKVDILSWNKSAFKYHRIWFQYTRQIPIFDSKVNHIWSYIFIVYEFNKIILSYTET